MENMLKQRIFSKLGMQKDFLRKTWVNMISIEKYTNLLMKQLYTDRHMQLRVPC